MKKVESKVKKYDWADIGERMLNTFVQGVLSYLVIALNGLTDPTGIAWKSILLGAIASGISCVMNVIVQELEARK